MTEEKLSNSVEDVAGTPPDAAATPEDAGAHGVLREAIRKVMEEIEHHERQARHHLQQAAELRKALRDSISYLHEQGEKKVSTGISKAGRSDKPRPSNVEAKEKVAPPKKRRAARK